MELPGDVLRLINEYSKPLTRPDWRTLHIMTEHKYYSLYHIEYMIRRNVLNGRIDSNYKPIYSGYHYGRVIFRSKLIFP